MTSTNNPFGKWYEIFNDVTLANPYRLKDKLKISSESSEPMQNWVNFILALTIDSSKISLLKDKDEYYTSKILKQLINDNIL